MKTAPTYLSVADEVSSSARIQSLTATRQRLGIGVIWLMILVLVSECPFFLAYANNNLRINSDPYVYAQAAKQVLEGDRLYKEAWQDKPPLGLMLYAVPQLFIPRSTWALGFFTGVCIGLEALMFAWVFRRRPSAALATVVFLTTLPLLNSDFIWPSTEHLSNLFVVPNVLIGYVIMRDRKVTYFQCVLSGLVTCLAFHTRQNCVLSGLIPALAILSVAPSWSKRLLTISAWGLSGLLGWALILGWIFIYGDFEGYFYTTFIYPRLYSLWGGGEEIRGLFGFLIIHTPFLVISCLALGFAIDTGLGITAIASFALGMIMCTLPMRDYGHYWLNLAPSIALLIAVAYAHGKGMSQRIAVVGIVGMLLLSLPRIIYWKEAIDVSTYRSRVEKAVAVADRETGDGTMWVCGPWEEVHFESRAKIVHPMYVTFQMTPPWINMLPWRLREIRETYFRNPPDILLVDRNWFDLRKNGLNPSIPFKLLTDLIEHGGYVQTEQFDLFIVYRRTINPQPRE